MLKRIGVVMLALVTVFSGIGIRLYQLTKDASQTASTARSSRTQTIAVSRGTVYDRYMQPLVNRSTRLIASAAPFEDCLAALENHVSAEEYQVALAAFSAGERALVTLTSPMPRTHGIAQAEVPIRYGDDAPACHLIGYINSEGVGVTGIEKEYQELLASYRGEVAVSYQVDAMGRVSMNAQETVENTIDRSKGGLVLTIDTAVQQLTQTAALQWLDRGAVVVSDAESGEILACVSLPLYDPNDVAASLEDAASPLLDRTLTNYNCGSVFKIITAAAALENGKSLRTTYTCSGSVTVDGIEFHCHNTLGDGTQTMSQAMANSCNCYFIQLAIDVGAQAIYDMAVRAGFDQVLTLAGNYTASRAILPDRFDLNADAALANFAIGQGDLLATAYHINALLAAVANDGVWQAPSLYLGSYTPDDGFALNAATFEKTRLFSPQTARKLQEMLCGVVNAGTGRKAAPAQGTAAGKTSTAETGWEIDGEEVVQSWFSGYYPADKPQYVITVLSENGGNNGKPAAPVFAAICNALFQAGLVETTAE